MIHGTILLAPQAPAFPGPLHTHPFPVVCRRSLTWLGLHHDPRPAAMYTFFHCAGAPVTYHAPMAGQARHGNKQRCIAKGSPAGSGRAAQRSAGRAAAAPALTVPPLTAGQPREQRCGAGAAQYEWAAAAAAGAAAQHSRRRVAVSLAARHVRRCACCLPLPHGFWWGENGRRMPYGFRVPVAC